MNVLLLTRAWIVVWVSLKPCYGDHPVAVATRIEPSSSGLDSYGVGFVRSLSPYTNRTYKFACAFNAEWDLRGLGLYRRYVDWRLGQGLSPSRVVLCLGFWVALRASKKSGVRTWPFGRNKTRRLTVYLLKQRVDHC